MAEKRSRRRGWLVASGIAMVLVVSGAFLLRKPSPVGHWSSAAGHDAFDAAYATAMEDLPAPDATLDVRTEYGVVRAYRFAGSGGGKEPLVLLPGRASASPVWADNLPSLLQLGDVYTLDLLGEPGMSVQERPIENDADQARWLDQALRGLPGDRFHLVGLSIGGWTAANLALHRPGQIATLTLIEPVYVFGDMPLGTIVRSLPAALPWLPKSWRDDFNSYTAGGAPVEDVPVAEMIEAGMRHYRMRLPQPSRIGEGSLGRLRMPVLAVIAGRSVMHDPASAARVAERALPCGTVLRYADASHAVNGEYPKRLAADIGRFLGKPPRC